MAVVHLVGMTPAGSDASVLEEIGSMLRGRLTDAGEIYGERSQREILAAALHAGVASDTAVRGLVGGLLCTQLALAGVLAGLSELTVALLDAGDENSGAVTGVCFASSDYFRYSSIEPLFGIEGVVIAGYLREEIDQGIRGAIERTLVRAQLTVEELRVALVVGPRESQAAVTAALEPDANATHAHCAGVGEALVALANGWYVRDRTEGSADLVVLTEGATQSVCTFVATRPMPGP